jgi:D-alanine-D-alanine ligase
MRRGKKLRLGIIFGGRSAEHEVSIQSARNIIAAADPKKYDVVPIVITREGRWCVGALPPASGAHEAIDAPPEGSVEVISSASPDAGGLLVPLTREGSAEGDDVDPMGLKLDVVFPVLHGTFGEDGTVQGLLELAELPYVGAGVLGSAVGMDKLIMKRLLQQARLPVVPYVVASRRDTQVRLDEVCGEVEAAFKYPVFVKPANMGSSVGVSKARNRAQLEKALHDAAEYDLKILIEKAVDAREIECSVLGNEEPIASVVGEIVPGNEFYDYAAKYLDDNSQLLIPAPLKPAQVERVQQLAVETFKALDCAGMARVDFFLDKKSGKLFVNEINTIPGFTRISMYPQLWEASGLPGGKLIDRLVELAIKRHREKARTRYSFGGTKRRIARRSKA